MPHHYSSGRNGRNNQPILFDNHGPDTRYTGPVEVAQTITSALGTGGNNTPLAVNKEPFCIAGNIVNRKEKMAETAAVTSRASVIP